MKLFPDFKFQWLAEVTKENLPLELDFINEGNNIEKVGKMLQKYKFVKVDMLNDYLNQFSCSHY